jgi:hypothetical protein
MLTAVAAPAAMPSRRELGWSAFAGLASTGPAYRAEGGRASEAGRVSPGSGECVVTASL